MEKTILEKLSESIKKVETTLIRLDKQINGDPERSIRPLSLKNPIQIAEVLRIKTLKLGLIGKLKAECYRAVKLYETLNDVKAAEIRQNLYKQDKDQKITMMNDEVKIQMKEENLDLVEVKYLQEYYSVNFIALERNIEAIKYKYNAFKR